MEGLGQSSFVGPMAEAFRFAESALAAVMGLHPRAMAGAHAGCQVAAVGRAVDHRTADTGIVENCRDIIDHLLDEFDTLALLKVKPLVDERWRTLPGRASTAIM